MTSSFNSRFISPNRPVYPTLDTSRATLGADLAVRFGYNGTGIGVAVIDSGISTVGDLNRQVVYSESFIGLSANEVYGHGTHVAGIIAGNGKDSSGKYKGLAPGANLVNLRVLDDQGIGTDSALIDAINRAIELKNRYNIRVINLSVGRPVYESYAADPLCQAVEQAWKAGIVVVAAAGNLGRDNSAGNQGYGTINSSGNDPYVITVGAMKTMGTAVRGDDLIASYSSKGPTAIDHILKPDIVAPGNQVVSVSTRGESKLEQKYKNNRVGWSYFQLSGTSVAAPMVSAAVAMLLEKEPRLTPDQVKARLMRTASKSFPASSVATDPVTGVTYSSYHDIFTVGAGYLDVAAALSDSSVARGSAQSPVVGFDAATNTVSLLQANGVGVGFGHSLGNRHCMGHQRGVVDGCLLGHRDSLGYQRRSGGYGHRLGNRHRVGYRCASC